MILFLQSCPSVSVFCDAIATNIFQNLYILVRNWRITIFSCLFKKNIPRQLALFEFQENFLFFYYFNSFFMLENLCVELGTFCI